MSGDTDRAGSQPAVLDGPDEAERDRYRTRRAYLGLGIGIVVGFVVTAAQVAWSGYHILPPPGSS